MVWAEKPAGAWPQFPCIFTGAMLVGGASGFRLQVDGYCSKAKVMAAGNVFLNRGW